jgi:ankyrin repeat protein
MMSDKEFYKKVYNEYCLYAKQASCVDFLSSLKKEESIEHFSCYLMENHKTTLLTVAIENKQIETVEYLLHNELVQYNYIDSLLHNYLHLAALNQNFVIFKLIFPYLSNHFNINYKNCFSFTYLHYACCYDKDIFYFLLQQPNIDIYAQNIENKTILTYLCHFGIDETVKFLLTQFPFDLNHIDKDGKNYLAWCQKQSTKDIILAVKEKNEFNAQLSAKTHFLNKKDNKNKMIKI